LDTLYLDQIDEEQENNRLNLRVLDWDDSQKSFLFTLKNPHNIPARRFVLKAEMKHQAIFCGSKAGPYFGFGSDLGVNNNCNSRDNVTTLGISYTNDTGLIKSIVFAGSGLFQVQEIEVFEITT
jgi:hypothetical protein